jgi:hypothetical protein
VKRFALAALSACVLAVAGCGSGHHNTKPSVPCVMRGGRCHAPGFGQAPTGDFGLRPHQLGAAQTIEGYDAVTLSDVPADAAAVGCYASGQYANCGQALRDFPKARIVTIATYNGASARCLDTEPGDAVPSQDPGWVETMLAQGVTRPCVYADSYEMGAVRADLSSVPRADYTLWLADWDGNPAIPAGYDAKQWASNCCIDRDSFSSAFFGPPAPPPPPFDKASFNEGYNTGFAAGMGKPYHTGYAADHTGRPKSAKTYDLGFQDGFKAGRANGLRLGRNAGTNTSRGTDYNTSFDQGFRTGYATGADRPFYTGFTETNRGGASDATAYDTGWKLGDPKGYDALFLAGYRAGKP